MNLQGLIIRELEKRGVRVRDVDIVETSECMEVTAHQTVNEHTIQVPKRVLRTAVRVGDINLLAEGLAHQLYKLSENKTASMVESQYIVVRGRKGQAYAKVLTHPVEAKTTVETKLKALRKNSQDEFYVVEICLDYDGTFRLKEDR